MNYSKNMKKLKELLTNYAETGAQRRVPTNFPKAELLRLVGAREIGGVVMYPHQWLNGERWQTTTFELLPK